MGSFNYTCAITGFPIQYGDEVRYFLLSEGRDKVSRPCYMHELWTPRTFPLKAKYNDHGSITEVETGATQDIWLDAFKRDLVPVGWGDNTYHDLPTSKDMTFEQLLSAIWEKRVRVKQGYESVLLERLDQINQRTRERDGTVLPKHKVKTTKGVPTMTRVKRSLKKAGLVVFEGQQGGYTVDRIRHGLVRVRWQDYSSNSAVQIAKLEEAQRALDRFASMATPGSGSYMEPELIVAPKPDTKNYRLNWGKSKTYREPVLVEHAMIREDVWQELLTLKVEGPYDLEKHNQTWHTIEDYKKGIRDFHADREAKFSTTFGTNTEQSFAEIYDLMSHLRDQEVSDDFPGSWILSGQPRTSILGLSEHWELMLLKGPPSEAFIDTVAEFAFIHRVLQTLRYWWRPSYPIGPQCWGWTEQHEYMQSMLRVSQKGAEEEKEMDEENAEDEDDGVDTNEE